MPQDTQVNTLILNTLTLEQYEGITPNPNELYFVTDEPSEAFTTVREWY